ncbi:hypothetical protein BX600DRAFT_467030 [Xylariales sp. PMI_506]|nr:hypothetical protein BX600DRAFT_467030 [Xylariales sp. PMI_506]
MEFTPSSTVSEPRSPDSVDSPTKRRKVRKGTSSCWECKRRKVRCNFASPESVVCVNCRRRESKCVTQDLPEELAPVNDSNPRDISHRIVRVEALVNNLAKRVGSGAVAADRPPDEVTLGPNRESVSTHISTADASESIFSYGTARPVSISPRAQALTELVPPSPSPAAGNPACERDGPETTSDLRVHADITRQLLESFPSKADTEILYNIALQTPIYGLLVNIKTSTSLAQEDGIKAPNDIEYPNADSHPVLLARQMLSLALMMQGMVHNIHGLSEHTCKIMNRLAGGAIRSVNTNEELQGTMEGLECLIMEGVYFSNGNNLHRAWLAFRRAIATAQMMGIHRASGRPFKIINPKTKELDPQTVWYRIIYNERYLCLLLGFPQGSLDRSMSSEAALAGDGPLGRLDRSHASIASRILESTDGGPSAMDMVTVRAIDAELLRVAQSMPPKFWLAPNFHGLEHGSSEEFWETWRARSQIFHYNLINQLHLPYLLRFRADCLDEYSKLACMNANREILTRFIALRSFNYSTCCSAQDLFALLAAITLLLAHLDTHLHRKPDHILAHQRLSDRTMMEQVLETMGVLSRVNEDVVSESGIGMLQCLLSLEDDAAKGTAYSARSFLETELAEQEVVDEKETRLMLRISIPYFGNIRIVRESHLPRDALQDGGTDLSLSQGGSGINVNQTPSSGATARELDALTLSLAATTGTEQRTAGALRPLQQLQGQPRTELAHPNSVPQFPIHAQHDIPYQNDSNSLQQYWHPSTTAGIDDWDFQGIDMSFFDSIIRGT